MHLSLTPGKRTTNDTSFAIEMVKDCLSSALDCGASDIHLQPRRDQWEVSYRIDGVLHLVRSFPRCDETDPVARLMAIAGLPTYRNGAPQEGSLRWQHHDGSERELRLGVFPTVYGDRAAIRIMEDRSSLRQLDQLGFDASTFAELQSVCQSREGWLLVAGPAGSGKTTTLYACLAHIATAGVNRSVLTIEDPIESVIDSISQSQIQQERGMTLASSMRAAVRQDAEVLLVSEIRDEETAEAVLSASMTGHLCFSSIHAGSVGATLRRLVQMKLPIYAIQSGLRGVLCQRLLRKTCVDCGGKACEACHETGYQGRVPIAQQVLLSGNSVGEKVFAALESRRSANEIDRLLSESGIPTLHEQATRLVAAGMTDEAEVFRGLGQPNER
ncbi:GspE/PulE family protein [Rhodopirellula sp. MGV]|uniref:GspE/PulE family protein n=1 Tax=Rhodopirellula sp. MGV TaxID=2023130 RepID=UPI000B9683BC|nr:ATPase, T2SS/T4P/T4SS family [Rhodopirellula sp. MGV]OYP34907.1 general secretion pathway protein GspE [Rhodopirellula sp. MGV]PNY38196.1 general secretion pathway protein GspE [Rhodopirellula baltica]